MGWYPHQMGAHETIRLRMPLLKRKQRTRRHLHGAGEARCTSAACRASAARSEGSQTRRSPAMDEMSLGKELTRRGADDAR
eukprot:5090097-Pleurochrysis_carterae.AAC.3